MPATIERRVFPTAFLVPRVASEKTGAVLSVGHSDIHSGILHVELRDGRIYEHSGVSAGEGRSLLNDPTWEHYRDLICKFYRGVLISSRGAPT